MRMNPTGLERAVRLRQEKGPDLVGDREQEQAMSHRKRDVERDCECI